MTDGEGAHFPGRIAALDVARGVALTGMGVYHLSWDLAYFDLSSPTLPYSPGMRVFSHIVAGAFLALAGASLALAHRGGPRWRAYFTRLVIVGGAAALVSGATAVTTPNAPIWFGILHCIVAASLLAAPLLRAPGWAALISGTAALAAPQWLASPFFNPRALLWLGLGTVEPSTLDWRPLLPWAGLTLIGLGLTQLSLPRLLASKLARWRPAAAGRAFAFAGRHSLAIYLVHQPVLFALLFAATHLTGIAARQERERYITNCRPACVKSGGPIEACAKACECVAERADGAGLAASLNSHSPPEADRARLLTIIDACGHEAR